MSRFELARAAVTALRTHVEQSENSQREYNIQTDLIVRESTGVPRSATTHMTHPKKIKLKPAARH
jgi:hypothetical protein